MIKDAIVQMWRKIFWSFLQVVADGGLKVLSIDGWMEAPSDFLLMNNNQWPESGSASSFYYKQQQILQQ